MAEARASRGGTFCKAASGEATTILGILDCAASRASAHMRRPMLSREGEARS